MGYWARLLTICLDIITPARSWEDVLLENTSSNLSTALNTTADAKWDRQASQLPPSQARSIPRLCRLSLLSPL